MDVREKLVELLADLDCNAEYCKDCEFAKDIDGCVRRQKEIIADHLIANGVTVQEWISASKPPKERGCYLISVKHWLDGKPVTREAFWNGADWLSCYWKKGDRVELTPRVTHWQYLPQPPKGE